MSKAPDPSALYMEIKVYSHILTMEFRLCLMHLSWRESSRVYGNHSVSRMLYHKLNMKKVDPRNGSARAP